jgi:hypothetical protein
MTDPVAIGSLVVSVAALGVAYRSAKRSDRAVTIAEEEHRQRLLDRSARPELGLEMQPSNVRPDEDGVIRTDATTIYINLAIALTNESTKPAGETRIEAWVPAFVESTTLKWMDPSGREETRFGSSTADPSTKLDTGDGRMFDTQRMTRTLDSVPLMGGTIYLRIACPVAVQGEAMIPIRVRAVTDGSEADRTHAIRLQHAKQPF